MTIYNLEEQEAKAVLENEQIKDRFMVNGIQFEAFSKDLNLKRKRYSPIAVVSNQTRNLKGLVHSILMQYAV